MERRTRWTRRSEGTGRGTDGERKGRERVEEGEEGGWKQGGGRGRLTRSRKQSERSLNLTRRNNAWNSVD